jgi:hypothetical protein
MATLQNPQRRGVLWVGDQLPPALREELGHWDLQGSAGDLAVASIRERELRAVLVPYVSDEQRMRKALAHVAPLRDIGAHLAIVIASEAERADAIRLSTDNKVPILEGWVPHRIARECAFHDPGRPVDRGVEIDDPSRSVKEEHRVLLQRAFNDFKRIGVEKLFGGLSDVSGVWRIFAFDKQGHPSEPFVVKAGPERLITQEIEFTTANVVNHVPFPHCPPLVVDRCVEGATVRLIVSRFIDRATRFDEYVLFDSPGLAVSALFDGPLRTWRRNRVDGEVQLGADYARFGVLPKGPRVADLDRAAAAARAVDAALPLPSELMKAVSAIPKTRVVMCQAHGDLHCRNIFVRRNSTDVILIDFASCRYVCPSARDPATLDVALTFDVRDRAGKFLPEQALRALYKSPLLPPGAAQRGDSRVEAVRQVRVQVSGEGISEVEYALTVAFHLLRFARFPTPPDAPDAAAVDKLKGLAYELGARLVLAHTPWTSDPAASATSS